MLRQLNPLNFRLWNRITITVDGHLLVSLDKFVGQLAPPKRLNYWLKWLVINSINKASDVTFKFNLDR